MNTEQIALKARAGLRRKQIKARRKEKKTKRIIQHNKMRTCEIR